MNQKAKKSRNYRQESAGSNVLFTLGLISVVALLIVGWVMTKGGMENVFSKNDTLPKISLNPSKTPNTTATSKPTSSPFTITTSEQISQRQIADIKAQLEAKLRREYEDKFETYKQQLQKQKDERINKLENQIEDLKMQIQMLEIDNRNLREEEG